ncbi:MAG: YitT family protein, partial [Odoribacteraceae bacterium]|nr:YitT family protein [Odoribacteraceae bacterium]
MKKTTILSEARSYAAITFGLIIYAFGVTAFLIPHKIVGGGVTGISTIIYFLTGETIPVGPSYLAINTLLVAIAMKILGPKFGIKTIYAVFINSALLSLFQAHIHEPLLDDRFMSTIIAGILCGVGVGISLINGGSTAGTDI